MNLKSRKCTPYQIGVHKLKVIEIKSYMKKIKKGWEVVKNHHIKKEFKFKNFKKALDFTNKVGKIAEKEGHHPEICLSWGEVKIIIYTHKIDGLHENDFILAAKIDKIKN